MQKRSDGLPSRREVCTYALGAALLRQPLLPAQGANGVHFSVAQFDRQRTLQAAAAALASGAVSIAQVRAPGKQDPQVSYGERSVGESGQGVEPFLGHAELLHRFNRNVCALTAAWRLSGEARYLDAAQRQLQTWCVDPRTRMLPQLELAGVVPGVEDDRNNGVCATVALASCARAAAFVCAAPTMAGEASAAIRGWFADLLRWFVESKKGEIARQTKTIEAICWTMQAAEFSRFVRDDVQLRACTHLFRDSLLRQMHFDGYFAPALRERNPFAASMFTLECMAAACESLSTPFESLWNATLPDGRGMHSAVAWALPFLRDRGKWPYLADRDHFKEEPLRQNALLFAGRAYDQADYIEVWKRLPADTSVESLVLQHPIAEPALWTIRPPA